MEAWRLIDAGPCEARYNMALDEALALSVIAGSSPPTLRLYGWLSTSVSIGRFQRADDIDARWCEENGVPVVRRPTGGRAVLHPAGEGELTYSFSALLPGGPFSGGLLETYALLGEAFRLALCSLGLEARTTDGKKAPRPRSPDCFRTSSYAEITVNGLKVVGSAQRRWPGGFLQQGSLPIDLGGAPSEEIFGAGNCGHVACLRAAMPAIDCRALKEAVAGSFGRLFGVRLSTGSPGPEEEALALRLLREKYLLQEWNLGRRSDNGKALSRAQRAKDIRGTRSRPSGI